MHKKEKLIIDVEETSNNVPEVEIDKTPKMGSDLVENTAYLLGAISPMPVTLATVIMTFDAQGFECNNQQVAEWFKEWKSKSEGATSRIQRDVFNLFHGIRENYSDSPYKAEMNYRRKVDKAMGRENLQDGYYENYERVVVADPETELRVFRWYQRIYPLITQMIMKEFYKERDGNAGAIAKFNLMYRPENYPLD